MAADTAGNSLYDLLETRIDAQRDEIERAYRAVVKRLQPKIEAGESDAIIRLRLLCEAYYILADPERRARYDASMKQLAAGLDASPVDRLGWIIIVMLVIVAIGFALTLFLLLERADDSGARSTKIMREIRTQEQNQPPVTAVPRTAPADSGRGESR